MSIEDPVYADHLAGQCLCGAVRVAVGRHRAEVGACHCSRCRRWSGSAAFLFSAPADQVTVAGPVRIWRHEIAERASCEVCGSLIWMRSHDEDFEFQVGFFDGAKDYPLISEIYVDCAFAAVPLAGDHKRGDTAAYEAKNPVTEAAP